MIGMILNRLLITDRLTARRQARSATPCDVLSVCEHDPTLWGSHGERNWIPLVDGSQIMPEGYLRAVNALQELWSVDRRIIVCCHAGESRSSAVVVGWLLLYQRQIVAEMQSQPLALHELPALFRETHGWAYSSEEAERREVSRILLMSPLFHQIRCCYEHLSLMYARVMMSVGIWTKLVESGILSR